MKKIKYNKLYFQIKMNLERFLVINLKAIIENAIKLDYCLKKL